MKTWPILIFSLLLMACGPNSGSSESGQTLADRFCVSDDAFVSKGESFSPGSLGTFTADQIEISLPLGSLNRLHQEVDIPIQLSQDMPYKVYMKDFLGVLSEGACFCNLLVEIDFNGQQKELVLTRVSGNSLEPVAILAGEYTFAECDVEIASSFNEKDIKVVKNRSCMGEDEEPVRVNLRGKLR
jgi:hypothetical protein